MKKLSKNDLLRREDLKTKLEEAWKEVTDAKTNLDNSVSSVNSAIQGYNEVVKEVSEWRDSITSQMEDYASERSEKWEDSDAGSSYSDWKTEWENLDTEEVELLDEIDLAEASLAEELNELPEEPE
jgi:chromosome segregation ATPase